MVFGNYYFILERKDVVNIGVIFNNINEVLKVYVNGFVYLYIRIGVYVSLFNNLIFIEE